MSSCLLSDSTYPAVHSLAYLIPKGAATSHFQSLHSLGILMQRHASATVQGLNPKFMATKEQVARLIGDRKDVFESEVRRSMGNNPDTSKALRCVSLARHHLLIQCVHRSNRQRICMACMAKGVVFNIRYVMYDVISHGV